MEHTYCFMFMQLFVLYYNITLCLDWWLHSCRELVVAFGRPGVRLPEKPTSGLQYSCSDQEFRLFGLTTTAPIDREEKKMFRLDRET